MKKLVSVMFLSFVALGAMMSCSNNDAEKRARKADQNISRMDAIDAALQPYGIRLFDVSLESEFVINESTDREILEKIIQPKLKKFLSLGKEVFEIDRSQGVTVMKVTLDHLDLAMKRAQNYLAAVNQKLTAAHKP